ncbi:MAG: ATP-binding protein [Candidatus Pedobacter colombiensis]|uniref:ATP-binding protein n=1 Tax=Candidatus Pedobacter colombiensis TaxID=3121371 RepID=A0AAJ5W727_9SPHI|nr:ATP-binding protein [Pedobacter sp.]WEK19748.1 MAG: ATP-binding protein [Pedobacter sp.]
MKKYLGLVFIIALSVSAKAQHSLVKLWETDSVVDLPESVLPDTKNKILYASQMGNNPNDKDGIGGVAKIGMDGKIIDLNWITGLNSPKGLGRIGNVMYAADLSDVVVIDIAKGKVTRIIPIDSAKFLNDITVSDKGIVYVSDSKTKRIHKIENGKPSVYMENIGGVNGLKAIGTDLFIVGGKTIWKADAQKKMTRIAELPNGGDGLEPVGNGDFLFTSWAGYVYYVYADGKYDLMLDTHLEKKNTADLGYDPVKKILYIPTFYKKTVMAYQLK